MINRRLIVNSLRPRNLLYQRSNARPMVVRHLNLPSTHDGANSAIIQNRTRQFPASQATRDLVRRTIFVNAFLFIFNVTNQFPQFKLIKREDRAKMVVAMVRFSSFRSAVIRVTVRNVSLIPNGLNGHRMISGSNSRVPLITPNLLALAILVCVVVWNFIKSVLFPNT